MTSLASFQGNVRYFVPQICKKLDQRTCAHKCPLSAPVEVPCSFGPDNRYYVYSLVDIHIGQSKLTAFNWKAAADLDVGSDVTPGCSQSQRLHKADNQDFTGPYMHVYINIWT